MIQLLEEAQFDDICSIKKIHTSYLVHFFKKHYKMYGQKS